jgi:biopolymer transport protein ExbD
MRALKRVEGINVVPLIDVVLVLLAIVLTISTFVASGAIKLNLPSSSSAVQIPAQKIDIAVDEKGSMFWNSKEVSPQEIIAQIETLNQDSQVSIRGDKRALFNDFIFILDRLKLQKIEKISIVTKRES